MHGVGQVAVVQDITPLKELETMRLSAAQDEQKRIHGLFEHYVALNWWIAFWPRRPGFWIAVNVEMRWCFLPICGGSTTMTASFPAHTVIEVLNEFFTAMVNVVHEHEGTVFDLAGDELMVGFGTPFDQEDAVERALRTAGDMQRVFARICRRWARGAKHRDRARRGP